MCFMLGTSLQPLGPLYLLEAPHADRVLRLPIPNLLCLSEAPHAYKVLRPPRPNVSSFSITPLHTHRPRFTFKPVCNCF
jgi:hypothetical protein